MSNKEQRVAWGPVAAAGSARLASWVGRHVSRMPGPAYATTKHAVLALTHSLNMGEASTVAGALSIFPGEVATLILKLCPQRKCRPECCNRRIPAAPLRLLQARRGSASTRS